jgi:hypothetical protein
MAYEIGSGSKALTLPNPFKTHNLFLLASALFVGGAAIWLLFDVRQEMALRRMVGVPFTLAVATALLVVAVGSLYTVLTQLKFYFGRARPANLTHTMSPEAIKETLRQQALVYQEPLGPIASALLAAVPNLMYAPPPIRHLAQWQFRALMTLVALSVSLVVTLVLNDARSVSGQAVAEYFGFGFLAYALLVLVRPVPDFVHVAASIDVLSVRNLALLIVLVFVGPIAVTVITPPNWRAPSGYLELSPFPHVFVFMALAFALYALFLAAMIRQLLPPPLTAVSAVQEAWNISCSPALIMGEFERAMQEGWREKIPNRDYLKAVPEIHLNQSTGPFFGEALEETQPFPRAPSDIDVVGTLKQRSTVLCVALDACGLLFTIGFAVAAWLLGEKLLGGVRSPRDTGEIALYALYALILGALGRYAFNAAFHLWRRFSFDSRLIWLEMNGQYVSGRVDQGNLLQGDLRSSTTMVQVEGMTFRLWVAEIHSMTYGKDARRFIVSMMGNPDVAEALAGRLRDFAANQATVAKLGNQANLERLATNLALSKAGGAPQGRVDAAAAATIVADPDREQSSGADVEEP